MRNFEMNQGVETENDSAMSLEEITEKVLEILELRSHDNLREKHVIIGKENIEKEEEQINTENQQQLRDIKKLTELLGKEHEKLIMETENFIELFSVLSRIDSLKEINSDFNSSVRKAFNFGKIRGSQKIYNIDEIKKDINGVRSGRLDIMNITQSLGLRDKVAELLEKEKSKKDQPFAKANDFMELFEILSRIDAMHGSQKKYNISEVKREINKTRSKVRDGAEIEDAGTSYITRSLGLRNKVIDLLEKEKLEREQKVK